MREYVLVGDSTEDLNVDVLKTLDVKILTFTYSVNDEVIPYYMDERDGDIKDFYNNPRSYKWRGWCSLYESTKGKTAVRR